MFVNGEFTVGNVGIILASDDGITWTNGNSPFTKHLYSVAYGGGSFVAAGFPSPETGYSTVLSSGDGLNWVERRAGAVQTLWGAAYGKGAFVLVGDQATILQSEPPAVPLLTPNGFGPGGFELTAAGIGGTRYRLQAATSLVTPNWVDLAAFSNVNTAVTFTDTLAIPNPARFYRLVSP